MNKLSNSSIDLLRQCVMKNNIGFLSMIQEDTIYSLQVDQYNDLREIVCDELIKEGFEDEKITQYGVDLEKLIDELGRLFM